MTRPPQFDRATLLGSALLLIAGAVGAQTAEAPPPRGQVLSPAAAAPRPVVRVLVPLTLDAAGATEAAERAEEASPTEPPSRPRNPARGTARPGSGKAWGSTDASLPDAELQDASAPGTPGSRAKTWSTQPRTTAASGGLRDPLLAPAAVRPPATPVATAASAPPADGSGRVSSIIVSGGEATLVVGSRRLRRGDLLDGARIERIDDSGYWLNDGARSRRVDLFPGVRKRIASPAPEPVLTRSTLRPGVSR